MTDVTSPDFRCYNSETHATATTANVAAGSQLGIWSDGTIYHPGVVNVYMAKAPSGTDVANWAGDGAVWFKVYEITAQTDGGQSIKFPAEGVPGVTFTLPRNLPSGQYLVRMEAIALHVASTYGGAQFYVSCLGVGIGLTCTYRPTRHRSPADKSTSRTAAAARPALSSPSLASTPATCVSTAPRTRCFH